MTRALVVIDVQESFRQRPLWRAISNPGIARDVGRLVEAARAAGRFAAIRTVAELTGISAGTS